MSSSVTAHSGAAAQRAFMAFSTSSARGQPEPFWRCCRMLALNDSTGPLSPYHLATDTVNGNASGTPLLDVFDETLGLCVVGNVKVVVVDVLEI